MQGSKKTPRVQQKTLTTFRLEHYEQSLKQTKYRFEFLKQLGHYNLSFVKYDEIRI